jgi:hypothetical protein
MGFAMLFATTLVIYIYNSIVIIIGEGNLNLTSQYNEEHTIPLNYKTLDV